MPTLHAHTPRAARPPHPPRLPPPAAATDGREHPLGTREGGGPHSDCLGHRTTPHNCPRTKIARPASHPATQPASRLLHPTLDCDRPTLIVVQVSNRLCSAKAKQHKRSANTRSQAATRAATHRHGTTYYGPPLYATPRHGHYGSIRLFRQPSQPRRPGPEPPLSAPQLASLRRLNLASPRLESIRLRLASFPAFDARTDSP